MTDNPILILVPRRTEYKLGNGETKSTYEVVEVRDANDYPSAIVHIDTFFTVSDDRLSLHARLRTGKTMRVEIRAMDGAA